MFVGQTTLRCTDMVCSKCDTKNVNFIIFTQTSWSATQTGFIVHYIWLFYAFNVLNYSVTAIIYLLTVSSFVTVCCLCTNMALVTRACKPVIAYHSLCSQQSYLYNIIIILHLYTRNQTVVLNNTKRINFVLNFNSVHCVLFLLNVHLDLLTLDI